MSIKETPILTVRPKFDPVYIMMQGIPVALMGAFGGAFVGGIFFSILFSMLGITKFISIGTIFISCGLLGFSLAPAAFYELKRKACHRTIYNFYKDRVEFQKFFWLVQRKRGRLRYYDINDVLQESGFIQQQRRLSSVLLFSPGAGFEDRNKFPGVRLDDLASESRAGNKIQDILDAYNNEGMEYAQQQGEDTKVNEPVSSSQPKPIKVPEEHEPKADPSTAG